MPDEKSLKKLSIFLMNRQEEDCDFFVKNVQALTKVALKQEYGLEGYIYYPSSKSMLPKWKNDIDELSSRPIDLDENTSNKAVIIVELFGGFLAIIYGYGRSLIKEECIQRNFGLKVALNILDPKKMRSVNTTTFEEVVVSSQTQASSCTSQENFNIDTVGNILRGITGTPSDDAYGKNVVGNDSLQVSVYMKMAELREKLKTYMEAYKSDRYKNNGFEWIDNINEVRDPVLIEELDFELEHSIIQKKIDGITSSPPDTVDWDNINGIKYNFPAKQSSFEHELDFGKYVDNMRGGTRVIDKMKRDRVIAQNSDGTEYAICSVYSSLVAQIELRSAKYVMCFGDWYAIDVDYYHKVIRSIDEVRISDIRLPDCDINYDEGQYNENVPVGRTDICLMDKIRFKVDGSHKDIESCDLFSNNFQFIHVKICERSSLLSHLFSQGKVSIECYVSDEMFRNQVAQTINDKFGRVIIDSDAPVNISDYEVIFAIITKKVGALSQCLPFFSMVNLLQTLRTIKLMHVKASVILIRKSAS